MELACGILVLALFSFLSFWKDYAVLYMVTAGIAVFNAFAWFDTYVDHLSLAVVLCLVAYAFFCLAKGFAAVFKGRNTEEE